MGSLSLANGIHIVKAKKRRCKGKKRTNKNKNTLQLQKKTFSSTAKDFLFLTVINLSDRPRQVEQVNRSSRPEVA